MINAKIDFNFRAVQNNGNHSIALNYGNDYSHTRRCRFEYYDNVQSSN